MIIPNLILLSIFPRTSHAAFGFPPIPRVFTDCRDTESVLHCTAIRKLFLYTRAMQEISTLRTTGAWLRQTQALGQSTTTRVYHRLRAGCSQINFNIIFFFSPSLEIHLPSSLFFFYFFFFFINSLNIT